VVVTVVVGAGFWMVLQTSPFIIWLAGSVAYLINQGIGCIQIMLINNRQLHPDFHVGKLAMFLLILATVTRWSAVAVWLYAGGLAEIVRRWQAGG
jgi:multidrug transporter EmrE-like cation transporter